MVDLLIKLACVAAKLITFKLLKVADINWLVQGGQLNKPSPSVRLP